MSTNHTKNYSLCQWEADDKVLRTDFNDDNAKIDAALSAQKTAIDRAQSTANAAYSPSYKQVVAGSFTGDGAASKTVNLGFRPSAVVVLTGDLRSNSYSGATRYIHNAIAVLNLEIMGQNKALEITSTGFQVFCKHSGSIELHTNDSGAAYFYLAVR